MIICGKPVFVKNCEFNSRPVANQFEIFNGNTVTFQSYESPIATIDHDTKRVIIYPRYDYSRTTAKWRNRFFAGHNFCSLALSTSADIKKYMENESMIYNDYGIIYTVVKGTAE